MASCKIGEILTCSICLETLKEPKILQCFHRFCKACLSQLVLSNNGNEGTFQCPTCRQVFDLPDEGVEGFKGDFLINELLEISRLEIQSKHQSKYLRERTCRSCDTTTTMVAFCCECEGLICKLCCLCHRTMKVLKGHTHLVPLEVINSQEISADSYSDTATDCSIHTDVIIEKYCRTCKNVVCRLCDPPSTHENHQVDKISKHERLSNISQRLDNYIASTKQNLSQQLTCVCDLKMKMITNMSEVLNAIETKYHDAEQEIVEEKIFSLQTLEIKKQEIEQRAKMRLQMLHKNKESRINEARTLQLFCEQHLITLQNEAQHYMDKLEETDMCKRRLTSFLSAIELQNDLQKHLISTTPLLEAIVGVDIHFSSVECSLLSNICWHKEQPMQVSIIDRPQCVTDIMKVVCNGKEKIAFVAGNTFQRIFVLDVNNRESTPHVMDLSHNLVTCGIVFVGSEQDMFGVVEKDGSKFYLLGMKRPDDCVPSKLAVQMTPSTFVKCAVQSPNGEDILISTSKGLTIYRCNRYDCNMVVPLAIKDGNCQPPVSLAVAKTCKDFIFLCDGEKKAIAIDQKGNVVCQFFGRNDQMDRPLKISVDRHEFVYVLWEVDDDSDCPYNDEGEEDFEEMIEGEYEGEYDIEYAYSCRKVVRQYSILGTFISEVDVYTDVTMMTTLQRDDNSDVLVVGSADGVLSFFTMTQFGRTWSSFIQKIGSKKKSHCLDPT